MSAPCSWPVSYAACGPCEALTSSPEDQAFWEEIAGTFLWNWTGQMYGTCPVTVRPCRDDCWKGRSTYWGSGPYVYGTGTWTPVLVGGRWLNISCGVCGDQCSCSGDSASLRLPGPISEITEILIDGVVMDPAAYRVDNYSLLVRTDGGSWPSCQDMTMPAGGEDTWSVEYLIGQPVPKGGEVAAGLLACELAKAACSDKSCQLPQRIQQVTRQGVTVTLLDDMASIDSGKTGIWLVDSWVVSVTKPRRAGTVRSVDVAHPRHRRTTWPG